MKKHGSGRFDVILKNKQLPRRSIQSMSTKLQKLLGLQSLFEYSGIKLDVDKVKKFNENRHGTSFYVEKKRLIGRVEKLVKNFFNVFGFSIRKQEEEVDNIFHRRLVTLFKIVKSV